MNPHLNELDYVTIPQRCSCSVVCTRCLTAHTELARWGQRSYRALKETFEILLLLCTRRMTLEFVAFFRFEIPSKLILGCTEAEGICISKKLTSKYFSNSYLWTTVNPTTYVFLSRPTFAYRRSARLQEVEKMNAY